MSPAAAQLRREFFRTAEFPLVLPCRDEGFLGQILTLLQVARHAERHRRNHVLVTPDDVSEGLVIVECLCAHVSFL